MANDLCSAKVGRNIALRQTPASPVERCGLAGVGSAARATRALLLALIVAGLVPLASAAPPPRLTLDQSTISFGEVIRGEQVTVEFKLQNSGQAPLHILDVNPGCKCTVASYDKIIEPGAVGTLTANVDTAKMLGPVSRLVRLKTDDPQSPSAQLEIVGRVVASVMVFPHDMVRLSNRRLHQRTTKVLVRKDPTETGELKLQGLRTDAEYLSVRAELLTEPRPAQDRLPDLRSGDWLIELSMVGSGDEGEELKELVFETGLPREPVIKVPVRVWTVPLVNLSVDSLILPSGSGTEDSRTVLGSLRKGLPLAELEVQAEPAGLIAELEPSGERNFKLRVAWPAGLPRSKGSVVLRVRNESYRLGVSVE